jgi:branched-chain amino acid aminotransferase group I
MKDEGKNLIYLNGSLLPRKGAKVSVFDRGFLYGDGAFETVRIYDGRPFMIDEHITRLLQGLKTLRFKKLPAGLKVNALKLIEANKVGNGVLRISVSRGELTSGIDPSACKEPTVVITAKEGIPYPEDLYKKGYRAIIAKIRKDPRSPLCKVKSANFLTHILAKGEATDSGVDEAIMLNYEGFITEGTVSNAFIVKGEALLTPSLECGVLPGVTRKTVMELTKGIGLEVQEREVRPEELYDADEAFLTNSLMEAMPLTCLEKRAIGDGLPGKVTLEIRRAYRDLAGRP